MSSGAWSLILLDSPSVAAGTTTLTFAGLPSAEAFGTSAVRDITPPGNIQIVSVTATKISRVAGKDTTQFTITANEPFVQFQIRRVTNANDPINAGTQVVSLLLI
jgi:hypothetical protein